MCRSSHARTVSSRASLLRRPGEAEPAAVEALRVADVAIEVLDVQAPFVRWQQRGADVAREQQPRLRVVEVEVAG